MRLLRAIACLVLTLTLVAAPVAHARALGAMQATASTHGGHAVAAVAEHAAHDCDPASNHPVPRAGDCQAACCFMPAQLPARICACAGVKFHRVSYSVAAFVLTGRAHAPDPEIPKA